jgi:transcription elongation factor Elf1
LIQRDPACTKKREKNRILTLKMTKLTKKLEIMGTRTGYVIRFTCPHCAAENLIVNKTPRDHYKEARDASCTRCRKRSAVLTPNGPTGKPLQTPVSTVIVPQPAP